jgi:RNA polymerase sigma-70 factor, ECF subfamily
MISPLTFIGDEQALVAALRAGHPGAAVVLYDGRAAHVHRTLQSALGVDADVPDLLQEVFIRAIERIGGLEEIDRVRSWLADLAGFIARAHIRRRTRRKLAVRETYELLDTLPEDERMAFVLRIVQGMTLSDGAP